MWISQGGKPTSFVGSDRIAPLLTKTARFSVIWQYDDTLDRWLLKTTTRTVFSFGIDDTGPSLYSSAGYSEVAQPENTIVLTDAYKGGAWLDGPNPGILLSLGIIPDGAPRIVAVDTTAAAPNTTSAVAINSGFFGIESAQDEDFFNNAIFGSQVKILPVGSQTQCSAFLGLGRQMQSGYSTSNSSLASSGRMDGDSRYTFNTEVFFESNQMNQGSWNPNRVEIDLMGYSEASVLAGVQRLPSLAARAATTLLVKDFILKADVAEIKFLEPGEIDPYTGQAVTAPSFVGATPISQRKIQKFRGENSFCGI